MKRFRLVRFLSLPPLLLGVSHLAAAPEDEIAKKLSKDAQQELNVFKAPTTVQEAWKIVDFEVSVGKFDVAAEFLKLLFEFNPTDKDFLELEKRYTIQPFLQLRNVSRWSRDEVTTAEARKNVEKLIGGIESALQKELTNPERIRKFALKLTGEVEEVAWATKELRRSGAAAMPELVSILESNATSDLRAAILETLPKLDASTVPPLLAYLDGAPPAMRASLLRVLLTRNDYVSLSSRVATDVTPLLWHLSGPGKEFDTTRADALAMLQTILNADPARRTASKELIGIAEKFYGHQALLGTQEPFPLWRWDGKALTSTPVSLSDAEEYYGLRAARWALETDATSIPAQLVFLSLALEKHLLRAGVEKPLAKTSPALYASLSVASADLLGAVLQRALRDNKPSIAAAVLQAIGDRAESGLAAPGPAKASGEVRPGVLIEALRSSDRRVQFAAAEAILKLPEGVENAYTARILEILREALKEEPQANTSSTGKRVLLARSDRTREEETARLLRRLGHEVELVSTGRDLFRTLNRTADFDLIVMDARLAFPPLPELLAQLRADARVGNLPLLLLAMPDRGEESRLMDLVNRLAEKQFDTALAINAGGERVANLQQQLRLLREREIASVQRVARNFPGVLVVGDAFTEATWQQHLASVLQNNNLNPSRSAAEKQTQARAAAGWLRRIALGEMPGYTIDAPTEAVMRRALTSDDLAPILIEGVARLGSREAQAELANTLLEPRRALPTRLQAAEGLIKHIQRFGIVGLSPVQQKAIEEGSKADASPEVAQKMLILTGLLQKNPRATGELLKGYRPAAAAPSPAAKEEPKASDDAKEKKDN